MASALEKAVLIDVKLNLIQCEVLVLTSKGSVNVENEISFLEDKEDSKKFIMLMTTTIEGMTEVEGKEEVAFNAKAIWKSRFTHSRKVSLSRLESHTEVYANKVYSYARSSIVDTLLKMGIDVSTMPWEINPNKG